MNITNNQGQLFTHVELQPVLNKEQTRALTGIHLNDEATVIQLCYVDPTPLTNKSGVIALNLSHNIRALAMADNTASPSESWYGTIIHVDNNHHGQDVLLGNARFKTGGGEFSGEINIINETYTIKHIGESLYAICQTKKADAA